MGNRCLSNYYVRTFRGHSSADTFGPGYSNGVPEGDLAKARDVLAGVFDDVLISEVALHPGTIERLGDEALALRRR